MDALEVMDIARESVIAFLYVAGPILLISTVIGVIIAFFQAITQIQEMTLTFVPKIIAIFATLLILLPVMGGQMSDLTNQLMERLVVSNG